MWRGSLLTDYGSSLILCTIRTEKKKVSNDLALEESVLYHLVIRVLKVLRIDPYDSSNNDDYIPVSERLRARVPTRTGLELRFIKMNHANCTHVVSLELQAACSLRKKYQFFSLVPKRLYDVKRYAKRSRVQAATCGRPRRVREDDVKWEYLSRTKSYSNIHA